MSLGAYFRLSRPFTLLAPAIGMVAAGVAAVGYASQPFALEGWAIRNIALGALVAALLNVASNTVNQIYDIEVDRINKPERPLPAGTISLAAAGWVCTLTYAASIAVAWAVNDTLGWIVVFTAALTYAYSAPPLRTKRHWACANITIAIPRGLLLPLAGWAAVSGNPEYGDTVALPLDAWIFAGASGLFILGAATTKDYADLEGDEAGGCITLPLKLGVEKSVRIVAPFLVVPWLAFAVLAGIRLLSGNPAVLFWGAVGLTALGGRAAWLLLSKPEALTSKSTHPAWVLMYLMMLGSQAVLALGYGLPRDVLSGIAP